MSFMWIFSAETWTLLVVLISLTLLYGYWPYGYFKKLGIAGPTPVPFFGTMLAYRKGFFHFDLECSKKYGRVWGIYDGRFPMLCVLDKAVLKAVLVKECYSTFTNRLDIGMNGPLFDALFVTKDDDWKRIRSVLSPSFTSGRLKEMFGIMRTHSSTLVKNLQKMTKDQDTLAIKEIFGAYSMDVITSTAFSVDIDSLNQPTDPFVKHVKKIVDFDFFNPTILIAMLFPSIVPLLEKMNFSFFPKSDTDFFFAALEKIKAERGCKNHQRRVDFMQLMVDSQTSETSENQPGETRKGLNDHEILSQSMIFIFAGYETSSTTLSFFFYNLATNPNTLKKLQEEIDQTFPNQAPINYELMISMDYLDAALSESLRLFPPAARIDRVCKQTVEINGLVIPKGVDVMVPTYALHRDPEYWSEPDTFNPDRFTKANKESIDPYTYMPFGIGPRNCIGMRFALVAMKLAIVEILQRFHVSTCSETKVPLELSSGGFLNPKVPIKLTFSPRVQKHCENVCHNNYSKS